MATEAAPTNMYPPMAQNTSTAAPARSLSPVDGAMVLSRISVTATVIKPMKVVNTRGPRMLARVSRAATTRKEIKNSWVAWPMAVAGTPNQPWSAPSVQTA